MIRATPLGFSFAGLCAGIKVRRADLGLVVSSRPAVAAGCFTTSRGRAASVAWSASRVPSNAIRAVVVASGNANCMNGPREAADVEAMARGVASSIGVAADAVLVATTGAIGIPFPIDKVEAALPALVSSLAEDPVPVAEAVRTTDTFTKIASREIFLGGTPVRVLGIAKGSGMVHPRMATVLGFLLTDADLAPACLDAALRTASAESFEMTTVDRETSTNDLVVALANGASGAQRIEDLASEAGRAFAAAIREVSVELARMVARDGEGARRLVTVRVEAAPTVASARTLARAVCGSNLVKAALFGADPAFGRVLAAIGAAATEAGLELDPRGCAVAMQGVVLFRGGAPTLVDRDGVRALLRRDEVAIDVDLGGPGDGVATAFGCDLTYDYVRINADYAAVLADGEGGAVRRDVRLETKTPELKADLLVAALGYIERFAGTRAVVRYGTATTSRPDLVERLAGDVRLLQAVGLSVILLQAEGDSEAMVTALGRAGTRSVGLSGADGNLLRARLPRFAGGAVPQVPSVDPDVVETLLAKGYVPVVCASWALPDAAREGALDPDAIAAELAIACGAKKLLFLCEGPGLVVQGDLVSVIGADALAARAREGGLDPALSSRIRAVVRALSGGVETVHLIDERVPHNVVAELFTDHGVGTMVR